MTNQKKQKIKETTNYESEYKKIFDLIGVSPIYIHYEWSKEGDTIQKFTLFKDHPKPILTKDTHTY